jgi:hypothetical protein
MSTKRAESTAPRRPLTRDQLRTIIAYLLHMGGRPADRLRAIVEATLVEAAEAPRVPDRRAFLKVAFRLLPGPDQELLLDALLDGILTAAGGR